MKPIRTAVASGAVFAGLLAGQLAAMSGADAGTEHLIQTADSPSTGAPIAGGGSWIVNKPSGYYLGRALVGTTFDDEVTSGSNWHYGRAYGAVDTCGWVMPGSLGSDAGTTGDSCSSDVDSSISHRLTVGKDFNAAAHAATDGTPVTVDTADPSCHLYLNYFQGSDYSSNGGHWADDVGTPGASVAYRFTTRDGAAVVVRDDANGWGFLPTHCVTRPADLYNDND